MAVHLIKSVQRIPISLQEAWDFFSDPGNLQAITPGDMGFVIISKKEERKMKNYLTNGRMDRKCKLK